MRGERHVFAARDALLSEETRMAAGNTPSGNKASGNKASGNKASKAQPSELVHAISAALVVHGVPIGSYVDVANGPPGGLGFTLDETSDGES
jgi:hypothetical protein